MAKMLTLQKLQSALMKDMDTARSGVLKESGDIIAERVISTSKGNVVPEIKEAKESVWTGVTDEEDYTKAMYEEKYGTRPFANTINWLRTREPFVRALRVKLPWVK
jgi:hypothetical protein